MRIGRRLRMRLTILLCFVFLTFVTDIFAESHYCQTTQVLRKDVKEKCSEFMRLFLEGYTLDRKASNLTDLTADQLEKQLAKWSQNPSASPLCIFMMKIPTNVSRCCGGWDGKACSTPICKPPCLNGGSCLEPGSCSCMPNYVGIACEDNVQDVTELLKYCYLRTSCFGSKPPKAYGVMTKEQCCDNLNGHGWGLAGNHCIPCFKFEREYLDPSKFTPDQPNVVPSYRYLSYQTCMGFGPNYWRTFDGLEFLFPGRCSYLLFDDGYHKVTLQTINCHSYIQCTKKLTITFHGDEEIIIHGPDITVAGDKVIVTVNQAFISLAKGIRIDKRGDYFWLEHGVIRLRWDSMNTFFLTVEESDALANVSTSVGLCGNNNANPFDDMKTPAHESVSDPTKLGNSWAINDPEVLCPETPSVKYSCIKAEDEKEAMDACGVLWLEPFTLCHDVVLVNHYFIRCVNDHCSAKTIGMGDYRAVQQVTGEVQTAVCQTLTAYSQICSSLNVTFEWRTKDLCPPTCPLGMVYNECWPKCIKTCNSMYSPMSHDCEDGLCYPGCSCPPGWFYSENECVRPAQCPCAYQGRLHKAGSNIDIGCNQCQCNDGRWNCTDRPCSKICSIVGFQHLTTFDGKSYEFHGPECSYTLVELKNDEFWGPAILSRGDLSITYSQIKCLPRKDISCINSVRVIYRREYAKYDVFMDRNNVISVNGIILNDVANRAYVTDDIYVRQMTSLFAMVQGFGFRVLYDVNGKLYVRLDPFFSAKVQGLCGNMDGSITNEFTSRSNIVELLVPFVMSFSDCPFSWTNKSIPGTIDSCVRQITALDPKQIPLSATERCKQIGRPGGCFEKCLKVIDWKRFEDYCIRDICASPDGPEAFCNVISALAYKCLMIGITVDWTKNSEFESTCKRIPGYGCSPQNTHVYSDCTWNVTRCQDMQFKNPVPDDAYCVPGCHCVDRKLLNDYGQCVDLKECTCYDRYANKIYKANEKSVQFQSECVCTNGDWECENGSTSIQCPQNQVYQKELTICASTCSTYDYGSQCPKDAPTFDGCGCPPRTVMLPNGTCVDPSQCPCTFDGRYYESGENVSVGCVNYVCSNRQWNVVSERNCKKRCSAFGDPHYITFDKFQYSFQGTCEYTLVKNDNLFQITAGNVPCGTTGVSCTKMIKMKVNGTEIHLMRGMNTTIDGVPVKRAPHVKFRGGVMVSTDLFTVIFFDLGLDVYWDGGTSVNLALSTKYSAQVGGLCGNFDGIYGNELVDLVSGQPSGTVAEFASRWKTVESCPDTELPPNFDPCANNTQRKNWALESCAIIKEGEMFAKCRKLIDTTEDYYKRCLFDSCGCDKGGDCTCFCTIVAAFARECTLKGECVKWRSHYLCPDMCENGKVYQTCAEPCKRTCSNIASKPETYCKQADHVEGCFCPKDYVENENGVCIPLSECPCLFSKDSGSALQSFPPKTTIVSDCQKCICVNGSFHCESDSCSKSCQPHEHKCVSDGKCIPKVKLCDGIYDCLDKSDEYPIYPCGPHTCSPKQYACASGKMCVPQWSICDGIYDCHDGSDEHNCEPTCEVGFFRCENWRCIPATFVCDGKNDCGFNDRSDEKNCSTTTAPCLYVDYYRCVNDKCIPRAMTCDGHDDCGDESDELYCYDCVGKLQVVDEMSPELKVEPKEFKKLFNSPNHTVPVKVIPSTEIAIEILMPNSYIVSFQIWTEYVKELQLVFLDSKGKPIENGTNTWNSSEPPGADVANVYFKKEISSNIVRVSLKPHPGSDDQMRVKAINIRACYKLVQTVCPAGYDPIEYRYSGVGAIEFQTTINDRMNGNDILEGSMKNVVVGINDYVAITRSIASKTFVLLSIRFVATNISTVVFTFTDASNESLVEGVFVSSEEVVYYPGVGGQKDLLRLTLVFKSINSEIRVGRLLMKACIKEDVVKNCEGATKINYNSRRTTKVYIRDPSTYQLTDAWNSLRYSPVDRWNMSVERDQKYQYIMEFWSSCMDSDEVWWVTFTTEGISEFQIVIGHDVVKIEKNIDRDPYTYASRGSILGRSVNVTFTPRDDLIHIYNMEVGICCWKKPKVTELPQATTVPYEAITESFLTPATAATGETVTECELDIEFNYRRGNSFTVSIIDETGYPRLNPRSLLRFSPPPGQWSSASKETETFYIRLFITERCDGFWEISGISLVFLNVSYVELKVGQRVLYSWEFSHLIQKNSIIQRTNITSSELDIVVSASGEMVYISDLQLEARCCSRVKITPGTGRVSQHPGTSTTATTIPELSTSTLESTLYSGGTVATGSNPYPSIETTTLEYSTTATTSICDKIGLDSESSVRIDVSIKDESGAYLPNPREVLLLSADSYWSTRTQAGSKYYINYTIEELCNETWEIVAFFMKVQGAQKVQTIADDKQIYSWDIPVPTSSEILVHRFSVLSNELLFVVEASGGNLRISDLYVEVCNCSTRGSSTATWSAGQPATTPGTTETELPITTTWMKGTRPQTHCEKELVIIDYKSQMPYDMTIESDGGIMYPDARQALRYSEENWWTTRSREDQIFILNFVMKENCSNTWEIAAIAFKTVSSKQVQLKVGDVVKYEKQFDDPTKTNEINERFAIHANEFQLIFRATRNLIVINEMYIGFCPCNETSSFTPPTYTMSETSMYPTEATYKPETSMYPTEATYKPEPTAFSPCPSKVTLDYNGLISYRMTIQNDAGTTYADATQALKDSVAKQWSTMTREDQLFSVNIFVTEFCSDTWEIATIGFKTENSKQVQLKVGNEIRYTWESSVLSGGKPIVEHFTIKTNESQLIFMAASDTITIRDLYIEFCSCAVATTAPPTLLPIEQFTTAQVKTESERLSTSPVKKVTEVPTTSPLMTVTPPSPCLPTHCINNDTFSKLNVSLVLVNALGENVGDGSPALDSERWEVPYKTSDAVHLEIKIWKSCYNPMISSFNFTVEGVNSLSLTIDNKTIMHKRSIDNGANTQFDEKGPFRGSRVLLSFDDHNDDYYLYGLEAAICCEYCPKEFKIVRDRLPMSVALYLVDESGRLFSDASDAFMYENGDTITGLLVPMEYEQKFSVQVKILEPCPTTWSYVYYRFQLDRAAEYTIRIDGQTITTSAGSVLEERYFNETKGFFPGADFELAITRPKNSVNQVIVYGMKLIACCVDLTTTVSTSMVNTGEVSVTTETSLYSTETVTATATMMTGLHTSEIISVTVSEPSLHTSETISNPAPLTDIHISEITSNTATMTGLNTAETISNTGPVTGFYSSETISNIGPVTGFYSSETISNTGPVTGFYSSETISNTGPITGLHTAETISNTGPVTGFYSSETISRTGPVTGFYSSETISNTGPMTDHRTLETISNTGPVTGFYSSETVPNTGPMTNLHTAETISNTGPVTVLHKTETISVKSRMETTELHTTEHTPGTIIEMTSSSTENSSTNKPPTPFTHPPTTPGSPVPLIPCSLKTKSAQELLRQMHINCLLTQDFNMTVCEGACNNRLVATIDFDYRRSGSLGSCLCCEGDGEVKTISVMCYDLQSKKAEVGEHTLTYMEYNRCNCISCGLLPVDGGRR